MRKILWSTIVVVVLLAAGHAGAGKIVAGGNESFVPVAPDGGIAEVRAVTDNQKIIAPDGGQVAVRGTAEGAQHVEVRNAGGSPLPVYSPVCSTTSQAVVVVGTSAVTAPTSPLPGRKSLRICVSLENVGSPKVKCSLDSTPVMGFVATDAGTPVGDVLAPGDCFGYSVDTTHVVRCVSDTAGTGVITYECS